MSKEDTHFHFLEEESPDIAEEYSSARKLTASVVGQIHKAHDTESAAETTDVKRSLRRELVGDYEILANPWGCKGVGPSNGRLMLELISDS